MGNQRRSKSLSRSSSPSPDRIPSWTVPEGVPRNVVSRRLSGSRTQRTHTSPVPFPQLGRPLRDGERQLLTVLADEYVRSLLLLHTEADQKEEPVKTTPPPRITRKGEEHGDL